MSDSCQIGHASVIECAATFQIHNIRAMDLTPCHPNSSQSLECEKKMTKLMVLVVVAAILLCGESFAGDNCDQEGFNSFQPLPRSRHYATTPLCTTTTTEKASISDRANLPVLFIFQPACIPEARTKRWYIFAAVHHNYDGKGINKKLKVHHRY